ncbi:alpha/beta hydrolase [Arenibaculum sp.]|uniref:alpha/beta hydrolase n=1 Tax=Arenibaculum sp. TaxID=2865862 RepID=UPI002E1412DE|nr:alpha/beta hydrolase [Arenibaculum sp.]
MDAVFSRTDAAAFLAGVEDGLSEIPSRDADYLKRFPVLLPEPDGFLLRNGKALSRCGVDPGTAAAVLAEGIAHVRGRCDTAAGEGSFFADWVGAVLVDAYLAAQGGPGSGPAPRAPETVADLLETRYERRTAPGGGAYYVRRTGTIPVILVNATGLPIGTWHGLLADEDHDYALIVPVRPHGDLFAGGIQHDVTLQREAGEIAAIVEGEGLDGVHVLGWCNGARLSVELVGLLAGRAASLTLVTPMLKGIAGIPAAPTPYARDLQMILDLVRKDPRMAAVFTRKLAETASPMDWSRVPRDDVKKAEEIFRLPNRRNIEALLRPLLTADSLANVARRVASDETHPTLERLSALAVPLMLVLGSHDNIVSNRNTLDTLGRAGRPHAGFMLLGAGHDIHDLQYRYLRRALSHFIDRRRPPPPTARFRALD